MIKMYNKKFFLKSIIFIILLLIITNSQFYYDLGNQEKDIDYYNTKESLVISQGPTNDTNAPIITFVQPEINNTVISKRTYTIIANITDENPPLFGNVSFQISNFTNFLFNATMDYDGGDQWSFNWVNISLYPNQAYKGYIIQIFAKDSSSNENIGMTGEFYIFLNIYEGAPGILQILIYLLVVCFVIAGIVVYLNRKMLRKISDKEVANA